MSKMKEIMLMYTMAAAWGGALETGNGHYNHEDIKPSERQLKECTGFGDNSKMHKFTIKGKEILATDKKMAIKKYNKLYK